MIVDKTTMIVKQNLLKGISEYICLTYDLLSDIIIYVITANKPHLQRITRGYTDICKILKNRHGGS
jgi:hypothetical protein